jgi:hypothetical protein
MATPGGPEVLKLAIKKPVQVAGMFRFGTRPGRKLFQRVNVRTGPDDPEALSRRAEPPAEF